MEEEGAGGHRDEVNEGERGSNETCKDEIKTKKETKQMRNGGKIDERGTK